MTRHLLALVTALCLPAWAPQALANGPAEQASFQDISQRVLSDQIVPSLITLEFHREWSTPGRGVRHEWIVATTSSDHGAKLEDIADLWLVKKHPPRDVSWHEAMNNDWGGKFRKHWGKEIEPGRPAVEAWMERYCMTAIPEPGTAWMLLSGLALVGVAVRKRRRPH